LLSFSITAVKFIQSTGFPMVIGIERYGEPVEPLNRFGEELKQF